MKLDRESHEEVFNIVACLVFCLEQGSVRSVGRYKLFLLVLVQGGTHVESPSLDIKDHSEARLLILLNLPWPWR